MNRAVAAASLLLLLFFLAMKTAEEVHQQGFTSTEASNIHSSTAEFRRCPKLKSGVDVAAQSILLERANYSVDLIRAGHKMALAPALAAANLTKWRGAFDQVDRKKKMDVLIFGGSMTMGMGCDNGALAVLNACSHANRTFTMLQGLFVDRRIDVTTHSFAYGGANSKFSADAIPPILWSLSFVPDVVVVDYGVNDMAELQNKAIVGQLTEAIFSIISDYLPSAATMLIIPDFEAHERANDAMAAEYLRAALHHGVAVVDVRSACLKLGFCPWRDVFRRKDEKRGKTHPSHFTHISIAETSLAALLALFDASCNKRDTRGRFLNPNVSHHVTCMRPTTYINAGKPPIGWKMNSTTPDGGWVLTEDRVGKPGWIARGDRNISYNITFPVKFGSNPKLVVTMLRSYESMCEARLLVSSAPALWKELNASWSRPFSVPFTVEVNVMNGPPKVGDKLFMFELRNGFSTKPNSTENVTFSLTPSPRCKFKLISIVAC